MFCKKLQHAVKTGKKSQYLRKRAKNSTVANEIYFWIPLLSALAKSCKRFDCEKLRKVPPGPGWPGRRPSLPPPELAAGPAHTCKILTAWAIPVPSTWASVPRRWGAARYNQPSRAMNLNNKPFQPECSHGRSGNSPYLEGWDVLYNIFCYLIRFCKNNKNICITYSLVFDVIEHMIYNMLYIIIKDSWLIIYNHI